MRIVHRRQNQLHCPCFPGWSATRDWTGKRSPQYWIWNTHSLKKSLQESNLADFWNCPCVKEMCVCLDSQINCTVRTGGWLCVPTESTWKDIKSHRLSKSYSSTSWPNILSKFALNWKQYHCLSFLNLLPKSAFPLLGMLSVGGQTVQWIIKLDTHLVKLGSQL